jgi:hypothetical protein
MHFLTLSSVFAFIGLAIAAPLNVAPLAKRQNFDIGQLSQSPPSPGFGVGQYGSLSDVKLVVNDVNILQFALMLEVRAPKTRLKE